MPGSFFLNEREFCRLRMKFHTAFHLQMVPVVSQVIKRGAFYEIKVLIKEVTLFIEKEALTICVNKFCAI